jgi:hypothetical protein
MMANYSDYLLENDLHFTTAALAFTKLRDRIVVGEEVIRRETHCSRLSMSMLTNKESQFPELSAAGLSAPCASRSGLRPKVPPAAADLPVKAGRPSSYTLELAESFCAELACGRPMKEICADPGMPDARTIFRWLNQQEEFQRLYAIARAAACDAMAAEILEIADDTSSDWIEEPAKNGNGRVRRADNAVVQRARLRIDSRKWLLSKLKPEKYGERVSAELTGANGGPIKTEPREQFPELKKLSDEDLLAMREILMRLAAAEDEEEEGANG